MRFPTISKILVACLLTPYGLQSKQNGRVGRSQQQSQQEVVVHEMDPSLARDDTGPIGDPRLALHNAGRLNGNDVEFLSKDPPEGLASLKTAQATSEEPSHSTVRGGRPGDILILEPGTIPLSRAKAELDAMDHVTWWDFLRNLSAGTGARAMSGRDLQLKAGAGISERQLEALKMEKSMIKRMNTQDLAVLILLAAIYFITLGFGWSIVYRMSANASTVTYYADPRSHPLVSDRASIDGVLADFDIAPVKTYVAVVGWEKTPSSHGVYWKNERWQIAFQFGLDLSSFVEKAEEISNADTQKVEEFIQTENGLQKLVIKKTCHWDSFEELSKRIKDSIKTHHNGREIVVDVQLKGSDEVTVYQNKTWTNFMHNKTTRTLFILSVVGIPFYFPYMWIRCTETSIRSKWRVSNSITNFWQLIEDKLKPGEAECFYAGNQGDLAELTRQIGEDGEDVESVTE